MKFLLIFSFLATAATFEKRFDSNSQILLKGTLFGKIESTSSHLSDVELEIEAQLNYLVGHLFTIATPAINSSLEIDFETERLGIKTYNYKASLLIAWDKFFIPSDFPYIYRVILPSRGDSRGLANFSLRYQRNCGSSSPFWYYYRPTLSTCPLNKISATHPYAFAMDLVLEKSDLQSEKKCPDYEKIWEDNTFFIVHVAGAYNENELNTSADTAISELTKIFDSPDINEKTNGDMYYYRKAIFQNGKINFNAIDLKKPMSQASVSLKNLLTNLTPNADLISYNGHSGYGENIRAFIDSIKIKKGKYTIGWLNACKPFFHLSRAWFKKVEEENDFEPSQKFLDLMMVSHIGTFSNGLDVSKLIKHISSGQKTYTQILWTLNVDTLVIGEEDNPICQNK